MSCCEKLKIDRLKVFKHANLLCMQECMLTGVDKCLVIMDSRFGKYYQTINYDKAIKEGRKIIVKYTTKESLKKKPKGVAAIL